MNTVKETTTEENDTMQETTNERGGQMSSPGNLPRPGHTVPGRAAHAAVRPRHRAPPWSRARDSYSHRSRPQRGHDASTASSRGSRFLTLAASTTGPRRTRARAEEALAGYGASCLGC